MAGWSSLASRSKWHNRFCRGRNYRKWQRVRHAVLERDNYVCVICGEWGNEVDHKTPMSKGGEPYEETNLQTLCSECHKDKTFTERNPIKGALEWEKRLRNWEFQ